MSDKKFFGTHGSITLQGATDSATGLFYAIQCIGETVFVVLEDATADASGVGRETLTYSDGFVLYGNFTSVEVGSGAATLYKTPPAGV